MASPDRQELLRNAVAFLTDPKTQGSSLTQRVQFLEAKGLTPPEIELAMRQAATADSSPSVSQYPSSYGPAYAPPPYSMIAPPASQWDWRDYFITAVISGSLAYGATALARKYLLPHLRPPTTTAYEGDRDALTAQFDAAETLLKEIQAETTAVKAAVEDQQERVEKVTADVQSVVQLMRDGETKTRDEMREIRDEVNNIRAMLPKMIERNKESQTQSLAELQQELKSLKALLLSRGPSAPGVSTSPLPQLPTRPSIPAWQLASSPTPSPGSAPSSISTPSMSSSTSYSPPGAATNGKGKEVAADDTAP
ncbi:peroxisomal membrane anchor protein conserved region-domain-containing protein [Amylostereum chailletii]|nr:peroxisomal membrane anchor protein conserved region-domain-containing protein [Amylostereum chailletii]